MQRLSRARLLRLGAAASAAAAGGALLHDGAPAATRHSAALDAKILGFVLGIERLQQAFYADALKHAGLTGELHEFAVTALGHERDHVALLTKALAGGAPKARSFRFGDATRSAKAFTAAARELEDLTVLAYNAGAPSLTPGTLAQAARIVSVEARHASWIRDIAGVGPAPEATEPVVSPAQVQSRLSRLGFGT
jgi:Ferritin-like domain